MYQTYSILQKLWLFIKLFTPMCITQFSLIGATFIAIFLTGQYSTTDLAGVATGYNLWLLFYIFAQGTLMGITPIISQLLGAKKTNNNLSSRPFHRYRTSIFNFTNRYIRLTAFIDIFKS